jgi:light-regulated signal transduction histidine kinase (bacteriophytochrome)
LLQEKHAELEQFAYVASHDLREPLRMITSYLQLLQRKYGGKLDTDADKFIRYAVDGASRMQNLIADLLSLSRVSTRGKEFGPADCEEVLRQSLENLQIAIQESGAEITHDPLPTVVGDTIQLGQLLQNLLANSIKFRGEQAPRVHVSARQVDGEWQLAVRDNGIGFDPQFTERIFVIFQRLHSAADYPGTGIGLSICNKIVQRHGGRIWAESEPGRGATFHFSLPVRSAPPVDIGQTIPAEP